MQYLALLLSILELSRRDDLESLVYILIFAMKGSLPWKGQLSLDFLKSDHAKKQIKEWRDPYGELCEGIEPEFRELLDYTQKLDFDEEPDYEYYESLLLVIKERYDYDDAFDWNQDKDIQGKVKQRSHENHVKFDFGQDQPPHGEE